MGLSKQAILIFYGSRSPCDAYSSIHGEYIHSLCKLSLFFHLSNLLCWIYENVKALVT